EEVDEWRKKDPIPRFERYLRSVGVLEDEKIEETREQMKSEVMDQAKEAEEADAPDPSTVANHVYADLEV
ncbi:MAG: pyruvate dehydrogenase (acetyl-transferring) E1 component subunit alpha, partial [Actinobacteria bacterium]|nr:pyruvate dehydrogenase (acetyl-transferring) E1 component subunit alpha [Actinomycetota bacterium]